MVLVGCERKNNHRKRWSCPRCGRYQWTTGHRCGVCKRTICCLCTDHLDGVCTKDAATDEGCAQAVAQKKLNAAQLEVLELVNEKLRETSKKTHGGWISGAVVRGLRRRGLVRVIELSTVEARVHGLCGRGAVEITDAGRALLKAAR